MKKEILLNEKTNARNSNIELLRIVSMIFIMLYHIAIYSNMIDDNRFLYNIFLPLGPLGNDIFVLISGYYLINKKITLKKILKLWFEVFFYSVSCVCVLKIFIPKIEISIGDFLPIIFAGYAFISNYFIMYLLSPFMNKAIKSLGKKNSGNLFKVIILLSFLCSFTKINLLISGVIKFIIFYFIGAYIQLYGIKFLENAKNTKIFMYMIASALIFYGLYICYATNIFPKAIYFDTKEMQIMTLVFSILIFYLFKNIKLNNNYILNWIAKCSLAVFLIHDNYRVRDFLWKILYFDIGKVQNMKYIILVVLSIWIIACLCEIFRKSIEKIIFNKKTDKLINKLELKFEKYFIVE